MALPKFIAVLKELSGDEIKDFEKYLGTLHQDTTETYKVFKHVFLKLRDIHPETSLAEIRGKKFKNLTDKAFANYLSIFYKDLEDWMIKQLLENDKKLKEAILLRAYQNHGLYAISTKYYDKIKCDDEDDYYKRMYAWMSHFEIYFSHNPFKYRVGANAANELYLSFHRYFSQTRDLLKTELINWSLLYPADSTKEIETLNNFNEYATVESKNSFLTSVATLLTNFEKASFTCLVDEFLKSPPVAGSFEETVYTFYLIRLNMISKKRSQESIDLGVSSAIYDFAFKRGVFNQRGKLLPHTFRNLVNNIAETNSLAYSLDFVEKYCPYVHSQFPKNSKSVCLAMVYIKHEMYDAVIEHSSHKQFHDAAEKVQCYAMHLAAWFVNRKSEPDIYQNVKNAFVGYFKRNPDKMSKEVVTSYLQFANVLAEIDKSNNPIYLSKYTNLMNRKWLTKYLKKHGIEIL